MEENPSAPLPDHWVKAKDVHHDAGEVLDFHYHVVAERLTVTQGQMIFFPARWLEVKNSLTVPPGATPVSLAAERQKHGSLEAFVCEEGDTLLIPHQGELHRVEIGEKEVRYTMWTPTTAGPCFQHKLDVSLEDLILRNLRLPEAEDCYDDAKRTEKDLARSIVMGFLEGFVANTMTMRTREGSDPRPEWLPDAEPRRPARDSYHVRRP